MRAAVVFVSLLGLPRAFGLQTHGTSLVMAAPGPRATCSRRRFGVGLVLSGLTFGPALAARAGEKGAPGAVVGTWSLTQTGVKEPSGGVLTFQRSGEATYLASGSTFQSVREPTAASED